jgi:protein-tyrosine phosphatase
MIDWHSHILPKMDDGSQSVEESLALLRMQSEQGVEVVIATPHYYADEEPLDDFLVRRTHSFRVLQEKLPPECPKILLGAEVRYYPGISMMENIKKLCVEGTFLLLLEMPFSEWTEYTVREVLKLSHSCGVTVILAHIERYLSFQNKEVWTRFRDSGILMQVNASFFLQFSTKRKALGLLKNAKVHFLGSDCHNTDSRSPRIGEALNLICKKFGDCFVEQMQDFGYSLLFDHA